MSALEVFTSRLDDLRVVTLTDGEAWSARDLMEFAGYAAWQDFSRAINRALESVNTSGLDAADHFRGVPKMVTLGSGARRQVEDVELTRYGCYILFQNADARKPEIAAAQQYFAVQTRRQELAEPQPELPTDYLSALRALVAKEEANQALSAKVAEDAPKVAYVEEFVDDDDVVLFQVAASELGMPVGELRIRLIDAGWIYKTCIGERWSKSEQRMKNEYEYRAASAHRDKFRSMPQHNAPRHHNGQVRTTLYVRSASLPAIQRRLSRTLAAVGT
ncbi:MULTISPECIES: phage antirepressor KilAC domain-containing protein [unclassified Cryobacterium]|uniref:phage antirepressor KilAC domain-containing protein n=1 Tax=unclassified Cryobacterium TaxID=2649013 RepID=UPI0010690F12|nr:MULTISPECIES: phage antirepressor KilAC domain-containing protein [unclassified Cryobacterium]TFC59464.1 phage antirepressor Ant [Cryobacterium sp. TMB3-1-2]TFC67260.1 phage antirepressor Ant [Cryobacterium sp. TMB3-15]TFC73227.1 phage antirepressor Ant [Cryobacterium sp. TMB3-10]TFD46115.1 phage antirepressor Ant [Cryobacterium sp. TMB3-12]